MSWSLELVNIITQALVTVVVGAAAVYVAFRQYRLDQRQVKLEQRRARVEIHERLQPTIQAVMTLLAKVTQDEIPREAIAEFTQVIARAIPLLDDERMIDYLNTLSLNVRHGLACRMRNEKRLTLGYMISSNRLLSRNGKLSQGFATICPVNFRFPF
jgi:hypothetical protein